MYGIKNIKMPEVGNIVVENIMRFNLKPGAIADGS